MVFEVATVENFRESDANGKYLEEILLRAEKSIVNIRNSREVTRGKFGSGIGDVVDRPASRTQIHEER